LATEKTGIVFEDAKARFNPTKGIAVSDTSKIANLGSSKHFKRR
jgi:hypothetical protein